MASQDPRKCNGAGRTPEAPKKREGGRSFCQKGLQLLTFFGPGPSKRFLALNLFRAWPLKKVSSS